MIFIKSLPLAKGLWGAHSFFFSQRRGSGGSLVSILLQTISFKKMILKTSEVKGSGLLPLLAEHRTSGTFRRQTWIRPELSWMSSQRGGERGVDAHRTQYLSAITRTKGSTNSSSYDWVCGSQSREAIGSIPMCRRLKVTVSLTSTPRSALSFHFTHEKHRGPVFLTHVAVRQQSDSWDLGWRCE